MYLTAKLSLLVFWIFCIICVAFAMDPRENSLPGFYGFELKDFYDENDIDQYAVPSSSSNALQGQDNTTVNEEFDPDPTETLLHGFYSFKLSDFDDEEEDVIYNVASVNAPVDDNVASVNLSEDDIILINACKDAVAEVFKSTESIENLNHGFFNLSKRKFYRNDPNYKYKFGYFKDLVKKALFLGSSAWSPQEFCEDKYKQYIGECVENIKKTKIDPDLGGKYAYAFMYFSLDWDMITLPNFFPDWIHENTPDRSYEDYRAEVHLSLDIHEAKLDMIQKYFLYLYNESKNFDLRYVRTPEEYCRDTILE